MKKHFGKIKMEVFRAVDLQLSEYMSGVNNHPNYGVDVHLDASFGKLHNTVDTLIKSLDLIKE